MATVLSVIPRFDIGGIDSERHVVLDIRKHRLRAIPTTACGVRGKGKGRDDHLAAVMPAARSMVIRATCPLENTTVGTPRYSSGVVQLTTQGPL